jgi:hypothetical protein
MPTDDFQAVWGFAGAPDAHLVAHGAEVTLCNQPATGLAVVDETARADAYASICWVCRATAQV